MRQKQDLALGEELISANGLYRAVLQYDGNFVVQYQSSRVLWQSNTINQAYQLSMQKDGNLVLYGDSGAVWNTNTQVPPVGVVLQM